MTRRKPVGKSRTARGATTPPARSRVQAPASPAPPIPTPDPSTPPREDVPHGQEEGRQEEGLLSGASQGASATTIILDDPPQAPTTLAEAARLAAVLHDVVASGAAGEDSPEAPPEAPPATPPEAPPLPTDPLELALLVDGAIRVEDAPWAPPRVRNQLPARVVRFTIRHQLCWDGTWWQHGDVWPLDLVLSCDERKLRQLVETGFLHVEVLHRGLPPELEPEVAVEPTADPEA